MENSKDLIWLVWGEKEKTNQNQKPQTFYINTQKYKMCWIFRKTVKLKTVIKGKKTIYFLKSCKLLESFYENKWRLHWEYITYHELFTES